MGKEGATIRGFKHERACRKIARYAGLEAPGLVWWRQEGKGKPLSYEAFLEVEMVDNFLQGTAAATEEGALLFFFLVYYLISRTRCRMELTASFTKRLAISMGGDVLVCSRP